jgi:hypothetical protein
MDSKLKMSSKKSKNRGCFMKCEKFKKNINFAMTKHFLANINQKKIFSTVKITKK